VEDSRYGFAGRVVQGEIRGVVNLRSILEIGIPQPSLRGAESGAGDEPFCNRGWVGRRLASFVVDLSGTVVHCVIV